MCFLKNGEDKRGRDALSEVVHSRVDFSTTGTASHRLQHAFTIKAHPRYFIMLSVIVKANVIYRLVISFFYNYIIAYIHKHDNIIII